MGLALCHVIPRDVVLQVALLFLFVSSVLQAVLIGYHNCESGVGSIVLRDDDGTGSVVQIACYPALFNGTAADESFIRICSFDVESGWVTVTCARFVESFHVVNGLLLSSFSTSVLVFLCVLVGVVPFSRTTTLLVSIVCFLFSIPTILHTAAVSMFFAQAVKHAKGVARDSVFNGSEVKFNIDFLSYIAIFSEVLLVAGFILVAFRVAISVIFRPSIKQRNIERKHIGTVMKLHLVNDDWMRQKTVLQSHARSVRLEMVMRECDDDDEFKAEHDAKPGATTTLKDSLKNESFVFRPPECPSQVDLENGLHDKKEVSQPFH